MNSSCDISQGTHIWHHFCLSVSLFGCSIRSLNISIHLSLSCLHFGSNFFNCLNMTIINWFGFSSLSSILLSCHYVSHSNFVVNCGNTFIKSFLHSSGFKFCLSNSLDMLTVFVNSWVFSLLFGQLLSG